MPLIRVYYSEKQKIVTIFAEFAITMDLVSKMSIAVYDFIQSNKIASIYSIGGIPARDENVAPFFIASTDIASKGAIGAGLKSVEEGVATGVGALLLVRAAMDKINDTDIMVPVQPNIIDPLYAELAIQSLNKLLNLNIDVTDLDKEAKMVEAKIKELISKHKETHENFKKTIDDTGPSMYA
jgi:predicted ATP-grasp superfamily ATP-dependent carboligase